MYGLDQLCLIYGTLSTFAVRKMDRLRKFPAMIVKYVAGIQYFIKYFIMFLVGMLQFLLFHWQVVMNNLKVNLRCKLLI